MRQQEMPCRADARAATERPTPRIERCPVCNTHEALRAAPGMLLCTRCCWAIEVKKAG